MTNPDDVYFESFSTEKPEYNIPVSNVTLVVNFLGKISKGRLGGFSVDITVNIPNGPTQKLSVNPSDSGSFEAGLPLDKHSPVGMYSAQAKYLKATSNKITFQVLPNK